ncbi:hypothetical protein [Pseudonocardia sp. 73-21]|uniref:hypothetical protein n=1 Tax=Pseudonocardia sp. 73-21 TaxID=1895809 RepID=UPI0026114B39|nr:hypothetical protein [Pseudonocardia sp. 73-21]
MTTPPPSPREIADLTARLRALTGCRADEAERAAFLEDKEALLDRMADDEGSAVAVQPPMTAETAARALAGPGRTLDDSRALVRQYLDEVSRQVGVPVHRWGLDEEDLRAIGSGAVTAADPEQARREQLATWHADDHGLDAGIDLVRER